MAEIPLESKPMTPASLEGKTLGKYRVLEPLGRGGMAQVYKAYHPQLDRYVAIKVLRADLMDDEEFLARFRREARAVAGLRHPHIVQVFDFEVQDDLSYMVMELLEGDTLKSYLNNYRARGQRMPIGELVRILSDALDGLGYAHQAGIIHRDIKPANIMLTRHGQAVLTDFGIAQMMGGTKYTISGALMGTLNYMAPEQGMEGRCDVRSDLYSLGIVFYEMLTGSVPFDADTPLAILMKHLNDPLPLPHRIDPNIPPAFERVALKVLAKNPDDRYQTTAEFAKALLDAAQESSIEVPASITQRPMTAVPAANESVAIFSGSARNQISDPAFAADDTDTSLNKKPGEVDQFTGQIDAFGAQISDTVKLLFNIPPQISESDVSPHYVKEAAIVTGVGLVLLNIFGIWISGMTSWNFFVHAWPMELAAIGLILSALMAALALPWFLIPAGLFAGNALVLAFSTLTGNWTSWVCLWPVEPLILAGSIVGALWLARRDLQGRWISRRIGVALSAFFCAFIVIIILISTSLTILKP
jgi:serine/threonine protein kinase